MKNIKVYEYKKCSTCVKALKFLRTRGVNFEAVDIAAEGPSKNELSKMLGHYKGDLKRLFNTSGQLYRELNVSEKLKSMSQEDALTLLSKHGMLVKRPFVLTPSAGLVGFKEDEWKKVF